MRQRGRPQPQSTQESTKPQPTQPEKTSIFGHITSSLSSSPTDKKKDPPVSGGKPKISLSATDKGAFVVTFDKSDDKTNQYLVRRAIEGCTVPKKYHDKADKQFKTSPLLIASTSLYYFCIPLDNSDKRALVFNSDRIAEQFIDLLGIKKDRDIFDWSKSKKKIGESYGDGAMEVRYEEIPNQYDSSYKEKITLICFPKDLVIFNDARAVITLQDTLDGQRLVTPAFASATSTTSSSSPSTITPTFSSSSSSTSSSSSSSSTSQSSHPSSTSSSSSLVSSPVSPEPQTTPIGFPKYDAKASTLTFASEVEAKAMYDLLLRKYLRDQKVDNNNDTAIATFKASRASQTGDTIRIALGTDLLGQVFSLYDFGEAKNLADYTADRFRRGDEHHGIIGSAKGFWSTTQDRVKQGFDKILATTTPRFRSGAEINYNPSEKPIHFNSLGTKK